MIAVYVVIAMNIFQEASSAFRGNRIFSMLTSSYQRTTPIVCRNCIFFLPKELAYPLFDIRAHDQCKKFAVDGSTPGNVTYVNANNERATGRCGPKGIYYQSRKNLSSREPRLSEITKDFQTPHSSYLEK
jgi:hypothetical protein